MLDGMECRLMRMVTLLAICLFMGAGFGHAQTRAHFKISIDGGNYPIIRGDTNLPNGTKLFINLKKPWLPNGAQRLAQGLAACGEDCLPATGPDHHLGINVIVQSGTFVAGPFSFNDRPFSPNIYPLEIFIIPDPKTATVQESKASFRPIYLSKIRITENSDSEIER
jgi:hypothetical protein